MLFLLSLLFVFGIHKVEEKTTNLIMEENTNIYYAMYNNEMYRSYSFFRYFQDGKRVYCIDPDRKVTTTLYEEVLSVSILDEETLEKINSIIHFGSDYPNHNTLEYELATQALIWEEIKDVTVKWYTERYSYGTEIDVSKERKEIEKLVKEYQIKPLFSQSSIVASISDHIKIEDLNHILKEYEIISFDGGQAVIENDAIHLKLKEEIGNYEIILKRKKYDNENTYYYIANNSQTMMRGRIKEEYVKIPIEIAAGNIEIQKKGISLNGEETLMSGVTFELRARQNFFYQNGELRYGQDELIDLVTTDENGRIQKTLPYGEYYLVEVETQENYLLAPQSYQFTISSIPTSLEILNYEKYGSLKLYKKDIETKEGLEGIKFLITNLETKEEMIYQTDENGIILIQNLPLGIYEVKEIETLPNYILNDEVQILELKEHQEEIEYLFYNEKIPPIPDTDSYQLSFPYSFLGPLFYYYEDKKGYLFRN